MSQTAVSIIIPCRNEVDYIGHCLDSILATDYERDLLELVVVDGMSNDGTREVIDDYARQHPFIRLIDNPDRIAPAALNLGIQHSRGDVIMRMDAHNVYPRHYIPRLVQWLEQSGADNVGGTLATRPANGSVTARAIATALSHPMGVGNAHFRIGVAEPRWVDTVPFGCYRRSVFASVGLFDEELARNQDDEFNARLRRAGGRILLVPDATSEYVARGSRSMLSRMLYQYGLFKPLAARKARTVATVRQLVPPAFVLALLAGLLLSPWIPAMRFAFGGLITVYLAALMITAARVAPRVGFGVALATLTVFPVLHVSYGTGYLRGLVLLVRTPRAARQLRSLALSR